MMGLRLTGGIERALFRRVTGVDPVDACDAAACRRLVDGGFIIIDASTMRATDEGRQRLNAVLAALLAG
jgi:oxygen-independent coproporphyrinogen-3 oxidase